MQKFRNAWRALGWLGIAIIVYLSLVPSPPEPVHFENADKLEHALAYGLVMLWFCQLYTQRKRLVTGVLLVAMGIAMEFLQRMTDYRSFEYADMLADGTGVLLAWGLAHTPLGRVYYQLEIYLNRQLN